MDNRVDIPGYKFYRRPDGSRPRAHVAFADLLPDAAGHVSVNGICMPVDELALRSLDARERNYDRTDVTELLEDPPGRTWAYRGSAAGRARLACGQEAGTAVTARRYLEAVRSGFRALGREEWAAFLESSDFTTLPVQDLVRVDLQG